MNFDSFNNFFLPCRLKGIDSLPQQGEHFSHEGHAQLGPEQQVVKFGTLLERLEAHLFKTAIHVGNAHRGRAGIIHKRFYLLALTFHQLITGSGGQPLRPPERRESHVGIVLTQQDAMLGSRCEHSIWLVNPFGHEVVDENTDVGLVALQHEWLATPHGMVGVDSCHQALPRSFLVTGRSVDLTGKK